MSYETELAAFAKAANLFAVDTRKLDRFTRGYLEAIAFTDGASAADGDELAGLDLLSTGDDGWGEGEMRAILQDCNAFQLEAVKIVAQHIGFADLEIERIGGEREGYTDEQAGRDFWLTRCGHGVGFWDRQFIPGGQALGDALTEAAGRYGNKDAIRGSDGRAYLC
jgi:hypothetical protein